MRLVRYMIWMMPMLAFATPYLLQGTWKPIIPAASSSVRKGMIFEVTGDHVISSSDKGSRLAMRQWKYEKDENEDKIYLELRDMQVIKRPRDWYNLTKYSKYIGYMNKIRGHGISAHIVFTSPEKDQILVKARIGEEELKPFLLEKINESGKET